MSFREGRCAALVESDGDRPCAMWGPEVAYGVHICRLHLGRFLMAAVRLNAHEVIEHDKRRELRLLEIQAHDLRKMIARAARRAIPRSVRLEIIERDHHVCSYCAQPGTGFHGPDDRPWHIDHIVPVVDGGTNQIENLALACARCNSRKHAMSAEDFIWLLESEREAAEKEQAA